MRGFQRDEDGNVTMLFGLTLLPAFLLIGAAVDYNRALGFRDFARSAADSAALAIAGSDNPGDGNTSLATARQRITQKYGSLAQDVSVTGSWVSASTYAIQVSASIKNFVLPAVPAFGQQAMPVSIEIRVERILPEYVTEAPTMTQLSPEAGDYNRLYMYCYNDDKKNESDKGRRGMVAIADNGTPGLDYSRNTLPTCGAGEYVSYKLRNVRNARTDRSKWDDVNQDIYEYYTDTKVDRGTKVLTIQLNGGKINRSGTVTAPENLTKYPILETILCDTQAQCKTKSQGGILPNDNTSTHTAQVASGGCANGKYMYWGWEDRPGGDRDYNDIRIVTSCPREIPKSDKRVHIVQ